MQGPSCLLLPGTGRDSLQCKGGILRYQVLLRFAGIPGKDGGDAECWQGDDSRDGKDGGSGLEEEVCLACGDTKWRDADTLGIRRNPYSERE